MEKLKGGKNQAKGYLNLLGLTMLGLGGAIGSGIFVASGLAVNLAGPSIILSFIIGGIIATLVMMMLAEMTVHEPVSGSFSVYAGEYLGPAVGFVSGWIYWMAGTLTLATEMVAAALIVRFWLPAWPIWLISLIIAVIIIGISLLDVRAFARVEVILSFIKAGILLVVVLLGAVLFTGLWPGQHSPGMTNYQGQGGIFPKGLRGFSSSLLLVLYTYAGQQVIGLATKDTQNPVKTVPRAVTIINITLMILYVGSIAVMVGIVPWNQVPQNASGFVPLFHGLGLNAITNIINAIILSAILSAMNSNMYGIPRMLQSLAKRQDAPVFLSRNDHRGVPVPAVLVSSACLLVVVGISYLLPHKIFVYIASASGVTLILNWVIIGITHLRFRQRVKQGQGEVRYPGYPYTTILALVLLAAALATSAFSVNQLVGLGVGLVILLVFTGLYFLLARRPHRTGAI